NIGVTRDGETIVCFHRASDITYELTQPIPSPDPLLSAETHDLVLKSRLNQDILKIQKSPSIEELSKMFFTTKHRWYPVGQFHTRRRNRNPPRDR
ncbi:39S ribosomal protein L42, mitochondrial, partial [Silurus asotus]